jgi:hypothetical protein
MEKAKRRPPPPWWKRIRRRRPDNLWEVIPPSTRPPRKRKKRKRKKKRRHIKFRPFRFRERLTHLIEPRLVGTHKQTWQGDTLGIQPAYVFPRNDWDISRGDRCFDQLHLPGPPYRAGGPFRKVSATCPWYEVQGLCAVDDWGPFGVTNYYNGGFVPTSFGPGQLSMSDLKEMALSGPYGKDYQDASAYGASAYRQFKPKLQGVDLPVALVETYKDGADMLMQSAKGFHDIWKSLGGSATHFGPKKAADHFLNHTFGWVPFVNDVLQTHDAFNNQDRALRQLARDNGKWIKRGGNVVREQTTLDTFTDHWVHGPYVYPPLDGHLYRLVWNPISGINQFGLTTFTTQVDTRIWFKGSFQYYVPSLRNELWWKDSKNKSQYLHTFNVLRYYGVRISPTILWKITPWSWLVDWFTNAGSVIDNLSDGIQDNLIARYAYIMSHVKTHAVNDSKIYLRNQTVHCRWTQEIESKRRDEVSRFGLGSSNSELSVKQLAILTALGISRGG